MCHEDRTFNAVIEWASFCVMCATGGYAFFAWLYGNTQGTGQLILVIVCAGVAFIAGVEWVDRSRKSATADDGEMVADYPAAHVQSAAWGHGEREVSFIQSLRDSVAVEPKDEDKIEYNPSLPEWMNLEGEQIDYLLAGPPYNSVFCVDLLASKETPVFYIYALRRMDLDEDEKASGIQSLDSKIDELLEQIIEFRESSGLQLDDDIEPAINIRKKRSILLNREPTEKRNDTLSITGHKPQYFALRGILGWAKASQLGLKAR